MTNASAIIKNPRITEKASILSVGGCYTFDIASSTTKSEVAKAVKELYKVTPRAIRTVTMPRKNVFRRGKAGVTGGGKKAYVYLKKGDKIEVL